LRSVDLCQFRLGVLNGWVKIVIIKAFCVNFLIGLFPTLSEMKV